MSRAHLKPDGPGCVLPPPVGSSQLCYYFATMSTTISIVFRTPVEL